MIAIGSRLEPRHQISEAAQIRRRKIQKAFSRMLVASAIVLMALLAWTVSAAPIVFGLD